MPDKKPLLPNIYKGNYWKYSIIPTILFFVFLFMAFVYPGIPQGIDLKGGNMILVKTSNPADAKAIESALSQKFDLENISVTTIISPTSPGIIVNFSKNVFFYENEKIYKQGTDLLKAGNESEAIAQFEAILSNLSSKVKIDNKPSAAKDLQEFTSTKLDEAKQLFYNDIQDFLKQQLNESNLAFQIKEVAPTIGEIFWNNALFVAFIALICIMIVIFIFFRELIPTLAIIQAACFDVAAALGGMALLGIPLSIATIPALLMIVGYSIDTDILLTTRVLKHRELNARDQAYKSMATGLTMTGTAIAASLIMLILSYSFQMFSIFDIAVVLFFGLIGDLISTWLMNAQILIWYAEKSNKAKK
ncbi:MAG: MMPL family transporter [archaeon]